MRTAEKYKEMGYTELSNTRIEDLHGHIFYPRKATSPLKAIHCFCGECMGMDRRMEDAPFPHNDIRECSDPICPLFEFRFGKNPFRKKRTLTDEQKKEVVARLSLARNAH